MAKPPPATDIRDVQAIEHDRAFFDSDRFGDVPDDNQAAYGGMTADVPDGKLYIARPRLRRLAREDRDHRSAGRDGPAGPDVHLA
jgi:hypothetical protein